MVGNCFRGHMFFFPMPFVRVAAYKQGDMLGSPV